MIDRIVFRISMMGIIVALAGSMAQSVASILQQETGADAQAGAFEKLARLYLQLPAE